MAGDILATLTYDAALAFIGHKYRVEAGDRTLHLTVDRVSRAHGPRPKQSGRDSFSIFFRGPADALLGQRMYDLVGESETFPGIFIVPVGRSEAGYEYEAVFT